MQVVQRTAFTAMAAGVVVHQHTRVLMANLHRCGDDMPVKYLSRTCEQGCHNSRQKSLRHTSDIQGRRSWDGRIAAGGCGGKERSAGEGLCREESGGG